MNAYAQAVAILEKQHVRPTRQRKMLAKMLFECEPHHFTAEEICQSVKRLRMGISRATVYNTLNHFSQAGLLREIVASSGQTFYDTNLLPHHHFYYEDSGVLEDIPNERVNISNLPEPPPGSRIRHVDVVICLTRKDESEFSGSVSSSSPTEASIL